MRPPVSVRDFTLLPLPIEVVVALPDGDVFKCVHVHDDHPQTVYRETFDCVKEGYAKTLQFNKVTCKLCSFRFDISRFMFFVLYLE